MPPEFDRSLSGIPSSLVQPHIVLPSQHFGGQQPERPELRLMVAVVQDAINCVEKYRCATDRRGRRLFDEVTQWFSVREPLWPFSFESICEVLRLDADAVRRALGVTPARPPVHQPHAMPAAQAPLTSATRSWKRRGAARSGVCRPAWSFESGTALVR